MKVLINGEEKTFDVKKQGESIELSYNGEKSLYEYVSRDEHSIVLKKNGKRIKFFWSFNSKKSEYSLDLAGERVFIKDSRSLKKSQSASSSLDPSKISSPMPGKVFKILKGEGSSIKAGETVLVLEAMKMEHPLKASKDGVILRVFKGEGDQVNGGELLVELEVKK